ncbi:MAG TPA: pyrimidine dimer DNA glycosylase/endonuclease V [Treponemataceae bacterium]|jgi:hypothetical protein|nr:pyrimidine dimer DNA glycosylase/endonuclease V [Treponemataceae bacterium]
MRLWSIHPSYLDVKGLLALWREALLAQKVLEGLTKGYKNHPQLERFKQAQDPEAAIGTFLGQVHKEAQERGYQFDKSKIRHYDENLLPSISVKRGQICYEASFLLKKIETRKGSGRIALPNGISTSGTRIELNPLFFQVEGGIEPWEKIKKD